MIEAQFDMPKLIKSLEKAAANLGETNQTAVARWGVQTCRALAVSTQAFGKTGGDILDFVRSLLPLPMHFVFIGHGKQYQINRGTEDEPLMVSVASPIFEGKKILNELPFLISHIFSARNTGRRTDQGKPVFALRTRKKEPEDYERTLCLRLNEDEEPNLTNIFNKILGK